MSKRPKWSIDLRIEQPGVDAVLEMHRSLQFLPREAWLHDGEDPADEPDCVESDDWAAHAHAGERIEDILADVDRLMETRAARKKAGRPLLPSGEPATLWEQTEAEADASLFIELSSETDQILTERGFAWEYRLFLQVWLDVLADNLTKKDEEENACLTVSGIPAILEWLFQRLATLRDAVRTIETVIAEDLPEACGPPGQPGYPHLLITAARKLAHQVCALHELESDVRRIRLGPPFHEVPSAFKAYLHALTTETTTFPRKSLARIVEPNSPNAEG